jgi:hypothetical protein
MEGAWRCSGRALRSLLSQRLELRKGPEGLPEAPICENHHDILDCNWVMSTAEEYDDVIKVSKVSVGTEVFTPEYTVLSASLGFMVGGQENVVSLQRSFDEEDGVCMVLSPTQQCVYDEFTSLTLGRDSLGVRFTPAGQEVFGVGSVRFDFSVDDAVWSDLRSTLATICTGKTFLNVPSAG